uniref:Uncharacterized protein n=1 Tax=Glossina palpalis gambiensis TaxID=67801 RepID=A0A1B0BVM9_9MUSC
MPEEQVAVLELRRTFLSHLLFFASLAVITAQVLFPGLRVNQVPLLQPTGNLHIVRTVELATPRPLLQQFK